MLRNRETVAGAVAREIDRIAQTGETIAEGTAYKAAFDRAGSDYHKHVQARAVDWFLFCRSREMRWAAARNEARRVPA